VYVSLTSIPSRVSSVLDGNLQSLLGQDYPIERIIVTIPTINFRGQPCDALDVSFLNRYPSVICHRPDYDWGPVMKYVGGLAHIPEADALVFVCDDDQHYAPNRVSNLVRVWQASHDDKAIVGWIGKGVQSWAKAVYTVHGVRGVLVPRAAIVDLRDALQRTSVPRFCAMNDDALGSIFFIKAGYHLVDRSGQDDEFSEAEIADAPDALHRRHAHPALKFLNTVGIHCRFNQPFAGLLIGGAALVVLGVIFLGRLIVG